MYSTGQNPSTLAVAVMILTLLTGSGLAVAPVHAARTVTDSDISRHIDQALLFDPAVPFDRIDVRTEDGVAILTGAVDNLRVRERATRIAETVLGVRAVVNRISVSPKTMFSGPKLEQRANEALLYDPVAESYEVDVTADDEGRVTLKGSVDSWQERRLSENVVKGVAGVTAVRNQIEVDAKADRPPDEIKPEIERRLHWDTLIHDRNAGARKATKRDADHTVGAIGVNNLIKLRPVPNLADTEIAERVKAALSRNPYVERGAIDVRVIAGQVYLKGRVDSYFDKGEAENAAFEVKV